MTTKTVIDLMRKYVRVADMCEAYSAKHNTYVEPWKCVLWLGETSGTWKEYSDHPNKTDWLEFKHKFAVAIVEAKPVFVGDKLYCRDGYFEKQIVHANGYAGNRGFHYAIFDDYLTWTKPQPKRTFMINGKESPSPLKQSEIDSLPDGSTHALEIFSGEFGCKFEFLTEDDSDNAYIAIRNLLTEERDKESANDNP
jgi:hypothetical protein